MLVTPGRNFLFEVRLYDDQLIEFKILQEYSAKEILKLCQQDSTIHVIVSNGAKFDDKLLTEIRSLPQDIEMVEMGSQPMPVLNLPEGFNDRARLGLEKRTIRLISNYSEALHHAGTPQDVMESTCKVAVRLFGVDHSGFVEFDDSRKHGWKVSEYPVISPMRDYIQVDGIEAEEMIVKEGLLFLSEDVPADQRFGTVLEHLTSKNIQSMLIVPVRAGEKVIGSFSLDTIGDKRTFDQQVIERCTWLANLAGMALFSLRREEARVDLDHSLSALGNVGRQITTGNLLNTLQAIVDEVHKKMRVDIATLYTYDQKTKLFVLDVGAGDKPGTRARPQDLRDDSSPARVLALAPEKVSEHTEDSPNHRIFNGGFVNKEGILSSFGMALVYEDEPVGVLFINYRQIHHFKEEELAIFEQFGREAAVIIKTARLKDQANKQLKALEGLYAAGSFEPEIYGLENSLTRIAVQALTVVGMDGRDGACISHVARLKGSRLEFLAASTPDVLDGLRNKIDVINILDSKDSVGVIGEAILERRTLNIGDVKNYRSYKEYRPGINSQISVLLWVGGRIFGVLSVESVDKNAFTSAAEKNLEHLAKHAEMAIQSARHSMLINGLFDVGNRLKRGRGIFNSLQPVAITVLELFGCDTVSIFTYNHDTNEISYPSISAGVLLEEDKLSNPDYESPSKKLNMDQLNPNSVLLALKESMQDMHCSLDAQQHPILKHGGYVHREQVQAMAAIPLKTETDLLVGFLFLNYRQDHEFSATELKEINIFGKSIAHVIDYYRHFDELNNDTERIIQLNAVALMNRVADDLKEHIQVIQEKIPLINQQLRAQEFWDQDGELTKNIRSMKTAVIKIKQQLDMPLLQDGREVRIDQLVRNFMGSQTKKDDVAIQVRFGKMDHALIKADPDWIRHGLNQLMDYMRESVDKIDEISSHGLLVEVSIKAEKAVISLSNSCTCDTPCILRNNRSFSQHPDELRPPKRLEVAQALFALYEGELECRQDGPGTSFNLYFPLQKSSEKYGAPVV
jgi:GAF domain-containing protein